MNNLPVESMKIFAESFAKSGFFGFKSVEQAMALMIMAQADGSHFGKAASEYHIISGKPCLRADAMLARFQSSGGSVKWLIYKDENVTAEFNHPQGGTVTVEWDLERAQKAQLLNNPNWKKYPRQMLKARVISEGVRITFPGVSTGIYTPEEMQDIVYEQKATNNSNLNKIESKDDQVKILIEKKETDINQDDNCFDIDEVVENLNNSKTIEELQNYFIKAINRIRVYFYNDQGAKDDYTKIIINCKDEIKEKLFSEAA